MIKLGDKKVKDVNLKENRAKKIFLGNKLIFEIKKVLKEGLCPNYYSDDWTFKFDRKVVLRIEPLESGSVACEIFRGGTYIRMRVGDYPYEEEISPGEEARVYFSNRSGQARVAIKQ